MDNGESKINESQKWLMLGVAIFFDIISLINLIPIIGWVIGWFVWIFAFMTFFLWFKMNGMSFSRPKNLFSFIGGSAIELIPILNILPAWTATILYLTRAQKIINETISQVPGGKAVESAIEKTK
jgi:hypothetical protein